MRWGKRHLRQTRLSVSIRGNKLVLLRKPVGYVRESESGMEAVTIRFDKGSRN